MPDKPAKDTAIDKEALDALNFKNNILAKLAAAKKRKGKGNNKTIKNKSKQPSIIRGLGVVGKFSKASSLKKKNRKRNTRTA